MLSSRFDAVAVAVLTVDVVVIARLVTESDKW